MKIYLVATTATSLIGIEQCRAYIVFEQQQLAFLQQYAGYILQEVRSFSMLPPVTIYIYNKGS